MAYQCIVCQGMLFSEGCLSVGNLFSLQQLIKRTPAGRNRRSGGRYDTDKDMNGRRAGRGKKKRGRLDER